MIKVRIILESAITHKESTIGEMTIANIGGGTKDRGNYAVAVARKGFWSTGFGQMIRKPLRMGKVDNYPRLSYNVWRLVARAILAAFPEEKERRKTVAEAIQAVSSVKEPLGPVPDLTRKLFEERGLEWVVRQTIRLTKAEAIENIDKLKES